MTKRKRMVLKINLYKKELDLYMDMISNIIPDKKLLIMHYHDYYKQWIDESSRVPHCSLVTVTVPDPDIFNKIKFEWIKWIKTDPNPDNRVADWEWRTERGLPDFDKLDKLVESRKTRAEKQKEIDDELELIKECERLGVDATPSKQYLKQLIRGR